MILNLQGIHKFGTDKPIDLHFEKSLELPGVCTQKNDHSEGNNQNLCFALCNHTQQAHKKQPRENNDILYRNRSTMFHHSDALHYNTGNLHKKHMKLKRVYQLHVYINFLQDKIDHPLIRYAPRATPLSPSNLG